MQTPETVQNIMNNNPAPRPCIVEGRRAIWHRWSDSARPKPPRAMAEEENAQYFQVWNVHAIIEFEDGTVARVWPSAVQFVDGGAFDSFEWPTDDLPFTMEENNAMPPVFEMGVGLGYLKAVYKCPACGKKVASYTYGKEWTENGLSEAERIDCLSCGQAIDWEGVPLPGQHVEGYRHGDN